MKQFEITDPPLTLDACKPCTLVWFDPSEFETIPEGVVETVDELDLRGRQALAESGFVKAATAATTSANAPYSTGPQPWITILCKFADITAEPHPPSWYQSLMGATYPGVADYYRAASYNSLDLSGSQVLPRWYTLPQPISYYGDVVTPTSSSAPAP